jgi:hypothetical protein
MLQGALTYFPFFVIWARMVDLDDANLARAVKVFLNCARAGTTFSISDAMFKIGIPEDVASTEYYIDKVNKLVKAATQGSV